MAWIAGGLWIGDALIACVAVGIAQIDGGLWIGSALISCVAPGMARIIGGLRIVGALIASVRGRNAIGGAVIASVGVDQGEHWSLAQSRRA